MPPAIFRTLWSFGLALPICFLGVVCGTVRAEDQPKVGFGANLFSLEKAKDLRNDDGAPLNLPKQKGGVYLVHVLPNGSAARAGLKVGDVVYRIDGKLVRDVEDVTRWASEAILGKKYRVQAMRMNDAGQWVSGNIVMTALEADTETIAKIKQEVQRKADSLGQKPVGFLLTSKEFEELDLRSRSGDAVVIDYECRNNTEKPIRAFRGIVIFTDLFDKEIYRAQLTHTAQTKTKLIEPEGDDSDTKSIDFNQFLEADQRLRNADLDEMKVRLEVQEVLFADGSREKF